MPTLLIYLEQNQPHRRGQLRIFQKGLFPTTAVERWCRIFEKTSVSQLFLPSAQLAAYVDSLIRKFDITVWQAGTEW